MIDVNKITSTLAKLPDAQLQQYAQMHKSDPYIMALAMSESNRRKELRSAGQGSMQEQPKVVDQEIEKMGDMQSASPEQLARLMQLLEARKQAEHQEFTGQQPQALPEDQGIGQLNAGDMNFAGGGIIAFADGGDVEHYFGGGSTAAQASLSSAELSRLYQIDPKLAADAARGARMVEAASVLRKLSVPAAVFDGGSYATEAATNTVANLMTPEQRSGLYSNPMMGAMAGDAGMAGAIMNAPNQAPAKPTSFRDIGNALSFPLRALIGDPALDTERKQRETAAAKRNAPAVAQANPAQDMAQFDAAANLYMTERAAKQAADAASKTGTGKGTGQRTGAGSGAAAAGAPKGSASLEALYKKLQPSEAEYAALDAKETGVANALKSLGKSGIDEFEAEEAKRGDVFKGREARLAEQGAKLKDREDKNLGAALFFAGAEMLQTPGGIGRALGAGIKAGGAQYVAGLDKLNAAQERLMDAKDRLEELRVNRDDLTSSERRKLKNQAKQYELEAEKLFLDGAHKKLGYKRDDAKNMFAGITTLLGQETAAGATIEAANIRSRDQKDYLAEIRGGSLVADTRKSIMDNIIKANPYADEPTRQRLYQTEWAKALQSNPALAKYAGVASGGGGGPGNFVFNEKTGQLEPAR
jgi:hypothetical protein